MSRVAIAAVRTGRPREIYRSRDGDTPDWDALVARILGPTITPADRERRRGDALALAAAAMRSVEADEKRKVNV
ncbi:MULTISPECIES: hypothetical protein [Burkholderia]|uniref:hypothetical protein n=1 Tax=Burkholderia TaxID=32008 RepID=UPI000572132F|nr:MULTISPECIES: hypothetical protein [Burkholderia]MCA8266313.1 hypothetical protein [Burkholderia vietnamiensis]MXK57946.1 hypothetical protein [Burkholderia pseudomallei]MXN57407.1 hypothetical protein [Burkholderia pseudomallei]ONC69931.1 hypothetical protein AQ921_19725 [Burkholderia pseudomallei]RAQ17353.1 hypothetical protein DPR00_21450 [Burkholderia pseudomallei]